MTTPSQSFEDLIVWQKAHQFVLQVYGLTEKFPQKEIYGLTSQFRRAAMSIAANISEGYKKQGAGDKIRFFNTAQGSLEECRYYLILGRDLGYADTKSIEPLATEVSKLLTSYSGAISRRRLMSQGAALLGVAVVLAPLLRSFY